MAYKILSIDGGGIKGVFSLQILKMLQDEVDKNILDKFDCFAGTSTGALIVGALASGFQPAELLRFYALFGKMVFPKRGGEKPIAKYDNERLKAVLHKILPANPMLSQIKKDIIIPTCYLGPDQNGSWSPVIYDNFSKEGEKDVFLIDAALRSAAAPIYFPSYQKYVDGGLYALNPSLVAFSKAIDPMAGKRKVEDIRLLSLGNGINPTAIEEDIDWDEKSWMEPYGTVATYPLFSIVADMGAQIPDYPLEQILKGHYKRINNMLPVPVEMDDIKKVALLKRSAKSIKSEQKAKWREYVSWTRAHIFD